jgi:hypothetical protein
MALSARSTVSIIEVAVTMRKTTLTTPRLLALAAKSLR